MQFFYTGATLFENPQLDPVKSLGGLISSTEIQNEQLGNIWGAISKYTIWNLSGKSEYRCIAIKNDGSTTLTGLKAFFESTEDSDSEPFSELLAEFEIAYQVFTADSCGDLSVPQITSPYSRPYNVTFVSAYEEGNALSLPNLVADGYLAIWLKRTIKSTAKDPLSSEDLLAIMNGTLVQDTIEEINLKLQWD